MTELDDRDRSRLARSGLASSILWGIVIAATTLIPARSPREMEIEEFPVVKLTLNRVSASAAQSSATQAPATAAPTVAPAMSEKPAVNAKLDASDKPVAKSAAPAKASTKSPAKAAPAKNTVKPVPGDLGIPDFGKPAATRAKADSREGELVFTGSSEESIVPRPKTARQAVPEFEGKAAVVERESAAAPVVSSRGQSHPGASTEGVSADTERSLSAIGGSAGRGTPDADSPAPGTGGPSSTGRTESAGQTPRAGGGPKADAGDGSSSIGAITFEGAPRRLVYPAKPSIVLPDRLSRLIDSDRTVTVSMTVAADGTVPASMISFSPAALLPPEVRDFLGAEFSRWRFEQGRGDGQARFLYSLRVQ